MIEVLNAGAPYVPVLVIVAFIVLVIAVSRFGRGMRLKLPYGTSLDSDATPAVETATQAVAGVVAAMQLRLDQYGEVATALEALVTCPSATIETASREWFSTLATRLAHLLRERGDHHHRVAVWASTTESADFVGVGYGYFTGIDDNMDHLERDFTIGGIAFRSRTGDYYCRDTTTDPNFKGRKTRPPSFKSVYGLALGPLNNPWGVMTVDSREANGFPDDARLLIRRFGELASLGALIWSSKLPPEVPSEAGPSTER